MELSVFYEHVLSAAGQRELPVAEVLRRVKEMGISLIELDYAYVKEPEAEERVFRQLALAGLEVSAIYGSYPFEEGTGGHEGLGQIELAARRGCGKVMIIPGFFTGDPAKRDEELERMITATGEMSRLAAERGITPLIEDFDGAMSPIATARG